MKDTVASALARTIAGQLTQSPRDRARENAEKSDGYRTVQKASGPNQLTIENMLPPGKLKKGHNLGVGNPDNV